MSRGPQRLQHKISSKHLHLGLISNAVEDDFDRHAEGAIINDLALTSIPFVESCRKALATDSADCIKDMDSLSASPTQAA
jgi:hypothetical protein